MKRIAPFALRGLLLATFSIGCAIAGPADYVYTPKVEFGEHEIDFNYGSSRLPNGNESEATAIGYGYGVTENWFTEVGFKHKRNAGQDVSQAEWENKFQLTQPGEYPVDFGAMTELEMPLTGNQPWGAKVGALFQKSFGKVQLNGNLLIKRDFGLSGKRFDTKLVYQWQAKYRLQPKFEMGVQAFGDMGKWNDWSQQSNKDHFFGPAVFGKLDLGNRRAIKYNAAWLFAASRNAPGNTLRMQLEYEY
ncbi:MAG: hypothetical protein ACOY3V_02990 [Pseudomonadota bacterium]